MSKDERENIGGSMKQVQTIRNLEFDESYIAHIRRNGEGWIGWIPEVPEVKCQERTKAALLKSLEHELHEALEADWEVWTQQFEADVKAGKLDAFAEKVRENLRAGRCTDL